MRAPARRRSCSPAARWATRGCSRSSSAGAPRRRRPTRSSPSGCGSSTAPRSTWAPTAPGATCGSSTPGTSSAWAATRRCGRRCSRPRRWPMPARSCRRSSRPNWLHRPVYQRTLAHRDPDAILPRSLARGSRPQHPSRSGPSSRHLPPPMPRDVILTPEGLTKLKDELAQLQNDGRREVAERIKEAREFGDISENSEYDDAKNAQAMLEAKIAQLEERIRAATVVNPDELSSDVVGIGSVVHVKDEKTGKSQKFTIVGSAEANPAESKLSNESPVGRALLGHKRNETVSVQVPKGPARKLKITKIDVGV